jgi:hypothetical protein
MLEGGHDKIISRIYKETNRGYVISCKHLL